MKSRDVVILFGGESDERMVSVASAQNLSNILPDSTLWFVDVQGAVFVVNHNDLRAHQDPFRTPFVPRTARSFSSIASALDNERGSGRAFYLGFHGGKGEDGTVQLEFEKRSLPFTGSGSKASKIAFNKRDTKLAAKAHGVAVAPEALVSKGPPEATRALLTNLLAEHGGCVVKPIEGGSSVGLCKVLKKEDIETALGLITAPGAPDFFAEAMLIGPELTVGVYEHAGKVEALPPSEVITDTGKAFDYAGKYLGVGTREVTPAEQPVEILKQAQELAVAVHTALGCRGYSRTDIMITKNGPVLLEINTLPGLTKASFIPQQLAAAEIPIAEFVEAQLAIARERSHR